MFGSTIGMNDIYGGGDVLAGGSATAPPASVQEAAAAVPVTTPGAAGTSTSAPAFSWIGMVALLIAIRVLYEYAE